MFYIKKITAFPIKDKDFYIEMRGKTGQQHHTEKLLQRKKQIMSWKFKAFNNLVPVESRPCNKGEQMTHWESHADFLQVDFHQNCNLPVVSHWSAVEM